MHPLPYPPWFFGDLEFFPGPRFCLMRQTRSCSEVCRYGNCPDLTVSPTAVILAPCVDSVHTSALGPGSYWLLWFSSGLWEPQRMRLNTSRVRRTALYAYPALWPINWIRPVSIMRLQSRSQSWDLSRPLLRILFLLRSTTLCPANAGRPPRTDIP